MEASDWRAEEKRSRLLRTLRGLQSRGVHVDGIGLQAHLRLDEPYTSSTFGRFLRELRGLGLDVRLTELDVIEPTSRAHPVPWTD
jgi:endo-1,4-beta-xylanase